MSPTISDPADSPEPDEQYLDGEEPARFWSRKDVAKFLGIHHSTVRRLEDSGELTPILKEGVNWFDPVQVRTYAMKAGGAGSLPATSGMKTTEVAQRRDPSTGMVETQRRVQEQIVAPDPLVLMARESTNLSAILMRHLEGKETKMHELVHLSMGTLVTTNQQLRNEVLEKDKMIKDLVGEKFSNLAVVEDLLTQKHTRDIAKYQAEAHENRLDTSLAVLKVLAPGLIVYATAKTPAEKEAARQGLFSALGNATSSGSGLAAKASVKPPLMPTEEHAPSPPPSDHSKADEVTAKIAEGVAKNADTVACDFLFEATPPGQLDMLAGFLSLDQAAALNQLFENYKSRYPERFTPEGQQKPLAQA